MHIYIRAFFVCKFIRVVAPYLHPVDQKTPLLPADEEPGYEYDYESKDGYYKEEESTDDGSDYEWNVDTTWQDNEPEESNDGQDKEEAYYEWNIETRPEESEPVDYAPYENAYNLTGDGYNYHGNGYNYHGDPITTDSYYYDDSWYNYRYYHHARSHRVYWGILGGFAGLIVMVTVGAAAAFFYQKRVSPLLM